MIEALFMLGGLGLVVGVGLAAASKIFYVYVDPLIVEVDGYPASLDTQMEEVADLLQANGGYDFRFAETEEDRQQMRDEISCLVHDFNHHIL